MKIYDEENFPYDESDDEMSGYSMVDDNSIFKIFIPETEPETIASPIPQNENTVILDSPAVTGLADEQELTLEFTEGGCLVYCGNKKVGGLKPAYVAKLKAERAGQKAKVYFKKTAPSMVRLVFGEDGMVIPE